MKIFDKKILDEEIKIDFGTFFDFGMGTFWDNCTSDGTFLGQLFDDVPEPKSSGFFE